MKSNVLFEATFVIGLHGIAVTSLREEAAAGWKFISVENEGLGFIHHDLDDMGVDDWLEALPNYPTQQGFYKVKGEAYCIEDEVPEYIKAEFEIIDT